MSLIASLAKYKVGSGQITSAHHNLEHTHTLLQLISAPAYLIFHEWVCVIIQCVCVCVCVCVYVCTYVRTLINIKGYSERFSPK